MSTRSLPFLSSIVPVFGQNAPFMLPIFLKRSLLFPLLFASIIKHCSLKKVFLSFLAILWNSVFNWMYLSPSLLLCPSLRSSSICKAPQLTTLPSCFSFSLGWFCSPPPVQYYRPLSTVHRSSGILLTRSSPLNLRYLYCEFKWDLNHTWLAYCFSQFSLV